MKADYSTIKHTEGMTTRYRIADEQCTTFISTGVSSSIPSPPPTVNSSQCINLAVGESCIGSTLCNADAFLEMVYLSLSDDY